MTEKLTSEEREALLRAACPTHSGPANFICRPCANTQDTLIEAIVTAHVAAAVAEAREKVAREIEALRVGSGNQYEGRRNPSQVRADAADIARGAS